MRAALRGFRLTTAIVLGSLAAQDARGAAGESGRSPAEDRWPAHGEITHLEATRLLRVRRLAPTWMHKRMDVLTRTGNTVSGEFRGVDGATLVLAPAGNAPETIPARNLARITIRREPSDLVFVGMIALGVGGLFAGVGALGLESDDGATVALTVAGAAIGAGVGWRTVYRDRVIPFD